MASLWHLNLDAEEELARPSGPRTVLIPEAARKAAESLLQPGDEVLTDASISHNRAAIGRAWMMTPRAVRALEGTGVTVARHPPLGILQKANSRALSSELRAQHPDRHALASVYCASTDSAFEFLEAHRTDTWMLHRNFGCAGRSKMKAGPGPLEPAAQRWIAASFRHGIAGLEIAKWVLCTGEFALHGFVQTPELGTQLVQGQATRQVCNAAGVWERSALLQPGELSDNEKLSFEQAFQDAAEALVQIGYFGPFGIDAFRYIQDGATGFHALSEINARYTMGWVIGMNGARPDLA
jgi:hypothetical protein